MSDPEAAAPVHNQVAQTPTGEFGRGAKLAEAMTAEGVDFAFQPLASPSYDGMFTLNHPAKEGEPVEPTVRLYRGVNDVDGSILHQVPYALKGRSESGIAAVDDPVQGAKVDKFISDPSYENLRDYVESGKEVADEYTKGKINERLHKIENNILRGDSLSEALRQAHIGSLVGRGNLDISPYISTAPDPENAERFGSGAVMVLDVPISKIAGWGEQGEALIVGELPLSSIKAVALKHSENSGPAIDKIIDSFPGLPAGSTDTNEFLQAYKAAPANEADKVAVSGARSAELLATIPDDIKEAITLPEAGTESYKRLQEALFDYYLKQMPDVAEYNYAGQMEDPDFVHDLRVDAFDRKPEPYNRDKVTDGMLQELGKEHAIHLKQEQRRRERALERLGHVAARH